MFPEFRAGGHETGWATDDGYVPEPGKMFPYLLNVRLMSIPPKGSPGRALG